jgi:hypothetical protein
MPHGFKHATGDSATLQVEADRVRKSGRQFGMIGVMSACQSQFNQPSRLVRTAKPQPQQIWFEFSSRR